MQPRQYGRADGVTRRHARGRRSSAGSRDHREQRLRLDEDVRPACQPGSRARVYPYGAPPGRSIRWSRHVRGHVDLRSDLAHMLKFLARNLDGTRSRDECVVTVKSHVNDLHDCEGGPSVKPSAKPTLVRTQHLPPPAETARGLGVSGLAGLLSLVPLCLMVCRCEPLHSSGYGHMADEIRPDQAVHRTACSTVVMVHPFAGQAHLTGEDHRSYPDLGPRIAPRDTSADGAPILTAGH